MGPESQLVPMRMARGSRCFGVWAGHELVGYGWLSAKPEWIGEVQLEITPGANELYVWNCVTLDRHRRKGVFRSLVNSLVVQAGAEGVSRLWIGSVLDLAGNTLEKAGFRPILRFETMLRFGFLWLRVVPMKGADPELMATARRALAIKRGSSLRRSRPRKH